LLALLARALKQFKEYANVGSEFDKRTQLGASRTFPGLIQSDYLMSENMAKVRSQVLGNLSLLQLSHEFLALAAIAGWLAAISRATISISIMLTIDYLQAVCGQISQHLLKVIPQIDDVRISPTEYKHTYNSEVPVSYMFLHFVETDSNEMPACILYRMHCVYAATEKEPLSVV